MNIKEIQDSLKNCPCGRKHETNILAVEIGRGLINKTAEILSTNGFPKNILVVADKNTLSAADGILDILADGGYKHTLKLYDNLRVAHMSDVNTLMELSANVDGILAVGSGSICDICRLAAARAGKDFAIFATAPSMDGFASDSAPIINGNFKISYPACSPKVVIGDTDILAAAPVELKAAGFGDMIAKYIAIVDWKISTMTTGEYYCENVANLTIEALKKIVSMVDSVTKNDPETAGAIMEALVLTGLGMSFTHNTRPASGAEHVISHFWEIKKLEKGELSDYHGKKVGIATLLTAKTYHMLTESQVDIGEENLDWEEIYRAYGENFIEDVKKVNNPTVTTKTSPEIIRERWGDICKLIKTELPSYEDMLKLLKRAKAATKISEIDVSYDLCLQALKYHAYMRHRMTLMRLIPMIKKDFAFDAVIREVM